MDQRGLALERCSITGELVSLLRWQGEPVAVQGYAGCGEHVCEVAVFLLL